MIPLGDLTDEEFLSVERDAIRRWGFYEFVKRAWLSAGLEATPIIHGWHLEQICTHLEAVSRGELSRLIINVPPGASKSTITSVLWPAWDWLQHPSRRWLVATFDDTLAWRDSLRCRGVVRSDWYQGICEGRTQVATGDVQATQSVWNTTGGGRRVSVTIRGKGTGWHSDIQVIDDPIKPGDVLGDPELARAAMERVWAWWTGTMASRRSGPDFARVIIMQRLSEIDLVGRILENDREHEWTHLMLPMKFEPERAARTRWGGDRRSREGELLCPARWDARAVSELERDLGSQVAAAQLQQRPAPASGNVFLRSWFTERWKSLPMDFPMMAISVDAAFKDKAGSDFVALHVWGLHKGKFYLVDRIHDRMGLPETVRCLQALTARWPKARAKLVEDKANGPAIEQLLRGKMSGLIMVTPEGGKVSRANAVAPLAEAGNVVLPDASVHPWAEEVLEELVTFPFSRHDDDVDACTQALIYLHDHAQPTYLEAMRRLAAGEVRLGG